MTAGNMFECVFLAIFLMAISPPGALAESTQLPVDDSGSSSQADHRDQGGDEKTPTPVASSTPPPLIHQSATTESGETSKITAKMALTARPEVDRPRKAAAEAVFGRSAAAHFFALLCVLAVKVAF